MCTLSVPSDGSPGCSLFICCCVVLFFTLFLHLLDVFLIDVLFEFEIIRLFAMSVGSVFDLVCNLCVLSMYGGCSRRVLGSSLFLCVY